MRPPIISEAPAMSPQASARDMELCRSLSGVAGHRFLTPQRGASGHDAVTLSRRPQPTVLLVLWSVRRRARRLGIDEVGSAREHVGLHQLAPAHVLQSAVLTVSKCSAAPG